MLKNVVNLAEKKYQFPYGKGKYYPIMNQSCLDCRCDNRINSRMGKVRGFIQTGETSPIAIMYQFPYGKGKTIP